MKKLAVVLFSVLAMVVIWFAFPDGNSSNLNQSREEIEVVMKLQGYRDIEFGREVKVITVLGDNLGPCVAFGAKYDGNSVVGGYCTPKFGTWGPVITDYKVENINEVIKETYK
ncbi:hypothetical protein CHUUTOTORO_02170 [Serratia phage vB_SmaM-ChuuTotoro]|nr:hypothetical protein CHUUTOTORO_02170 [Serratia phage vB_SmaM-ChuuTotoro]